MIIILFFFSNKVFCKNRILTIIGNTDTQTKQFHQSPNKFEMFLNAYENNRFIESYAISNVILPQKKMVKVGNQLISQLKHRFTVKIIGEKEFIDVAENKTVKLKLVEIIEATPIVRKPIFKLDTSKTFDLVGKWKYIGFIHSTDSILDNNMTKSCYDKTPYKFETFPKIFDSIFYPPVMHENYNIEFTNVVVTYGIENDYFFKAHNCNSVINGGYNIKNNKQLTSCDIYYGYENSYSASCIEVFFYDAVYEQSIENINSYSLNHNILKLHDKNSPRQMIFVRDEK